MEPITFLLEAAKRHKFLKYAVAVAAIAAVAALAYEWFANPRAALLGTVVVIVLMVVVSIFSALVSPQRRSNPTRPQGPKLTAIVLEWFCLALFMVGTVVVVASILLPSPYPLSYWFSGETRVPRPDPVSVDRPLSVPGGPAQTVTCSFGAFTDGVCKPARGSINLPEDMMVRLFTSCTANGGKDEYTPNCCDHLTRSLADRLGVCR